MINTDGIPTKWHESMPYERRLPKSIYVTPSDLMAYMQDPSSLRNTRNLNLGAEISSLSWSEISCVILVYGALNRPQHDIMILVFF